MANKSSKTGVSSDLHYMTGQILHPNPAATSGRNPLLRIPVKHPGFRCDGNPTPAMAADVIGDGSTPLNEYPSTQYQ